MLLNLTSLTGWRLLLFIITKMGSVCEIRSRKKGRFLIKTFAQMRNGVEIEAGCISEYKIFSVSTPLIFHSSQVIQVKTRRLPFIQLILKWVVHTKTNNYILQYEYINLNCSQLKKKKKETHVDAGIHSPTKTIANNWRCNPSGSTGPAIGLNLGGFLWNNATVVLVGF